MFYEMTVREFDDLTPILKSVLNTKTEKKKKKMPTKKKKKKMVGCKHITLIVMNLVINSLWLSSLWHDVVVSIVLALSQPFILVWWQIPSKHTYMYIWMYLSCSWYCYTSGNILKSYLKTVFGGEGLMSLLSADYNWCGKKTKKNKTCDGPMLDIFFFVFSGTKHCS